MPFVWFTGQERIAPLLVAGRWLLCLKARQLGLTWLLAAYALWRCVYTPNFAVVVVSYEKGYAADFLDRCRWIEDRLPSWLQGRRVTDNVFELAWANGSTMVATVGGQKAARSITADLVIVDEASRVPELAATLGAAEPAVEVARGQIILNTTSAGPTGDFHEIWKATYGTAAELLDETGRGPTGYHVVFLAWWERPGRDQAWHLEACAKLARISPVLGKQEYPSSIEEAWEHAAGRIYPLFTRDRCVGDVTVTSGWRRYRAVDWGDAASPFVCLWIAHLRGPPGLLVSPGCPNTIREMIAWRWDEDRPGKPVERDDHTCDALRYAVVTFRFVGLVYVYRELYLTDSASKGWNPLTEIRQVHEMSGWESAEPGARVLWRPTPVADPIAGTVCDRSQRKLINLYRAQQIPCRGQSRFRKRGGDDAGVDKSPTETLEGVRLVSALIEASEALEVAVDVQREQRFAIDRRERQLAAEGLLVTHSLQDRIADAARRLLKGKARAQTQDSQ